LHLCEAESISYLDEVASSPWSLDLAKSVVLEVSLINVLAHVVVFDVEWQADGTLIIFVLPDTSAKPKHFEKLIISFHLQ
jgi:hypothetical protein